MTFFIINILYDDVSNIFIPYKPDITRGYLFLLQQINFTFRVCLKITNYFLNMDNVIIFSIMASKIINILSHTEDHVHRRPRGG